MKETILLATALLFTVIIVGSVLAQEQIIYPSKGQSAEQMEKDKFECYTWAKDQTGFDPMEVPKVTAPPPQQQSGGVVRVGPRARRQNTANQQKQEQWKQEQVGNYQKNRDSYNRAYCACLEGRSYSVQ